MSRRQLADAENALDAAQQRLTNYRQNRGDIDPQATGQAQLGLVSELRGQLSAARAQLIAMGRAIDHSSPQYRALSGRVSALEGQVNAQAGRLTGGGQAIANDIGGYQDLQIRQQFLAKRYEAAAAAMDRARDQALRQQLYVVRVVDANMPVKALYPERWRILGTVLIALLLTYSIGWLIAAGVREHAA
jgi:capsular polysaccharide transport system permease protein